MKFTYKEIPISFSPSSKRKKSIYRPIISVILIRYKKLIGYEALIDSGSDYNVFDAAVAGVLGINISAGNKRQIAGLGGEKIKGYEHKLILKIAGKQYNSSVIFSKQIPPNSFGILGNQGFFDNFRLTFKYPKYIEIL